MNKFVVIDKKATPVNLPDNFDDYADGVVIPIDKPYGWTSADVVRKVKFRIQKHFHRKNIKVGHAGTLDPLATGVLLLCIGKATKSAEMLQASTKEYIAQITFGATTPSFDLEKEIDARYNYDHITRESIEKILVNFIGEIDQVPPIFSAKLIDGTRAYEYARSGEEVEMRSSRITIQELEILNFDSPVLTLRIRCSKGTYIRSLARDLGIALESGAHLTGLIRTLSGEFRLNDSLSMDDFEKIFQI